MKDLEIAIVLLGRQQDRLSRQIKALYDEDFDYPSLRRWRDGWASELPLLKYHRELLPAVDRLLKEMTEGRCSFPVMDKARLAVWKYHKACWPLLKDMGIRKLPRQADSLKVDTSPVICRRNSAGGTRPSESWGRSSL